MRKYREKHQDVSEKAMEDPIDLRAEALGGRLPGTMFQSCFASHGCEASESQVVTSAYNRCEYVPESSTELELVLTDSAIR